MIFLKQSTSSTISFGPAVANTDGVTLVTTLVGTGSNQFENTSTGIQLSKNGAAMAVRHATAGASTYLAYGMYAVILDTTDTNTLGILRVSFSSATTVCPIWIDCMIMPANMYNSMFNTGGSIPDAVAGASAGLLISGSNSGTTTLGALTVTGTTTHTGTTVHTGNVSYADGLTVSAPSTGNRAGITVTGNGTGAGVSITGGNGATGNAMDLIAAATNGKGLNISGLGSGAGMIVTGGATGVGFNIVGGGTSGDGLSVSATSGHGITAAGTGTTKHGINATGGATTSHGINAVGGGVGHGIYAKSGGGATGDGVRAESVATDGNGMNLIGHGTANGMLSTGGASAGGDGIEAAAGGGVDIRGNQTGNLVGNVSSVTGLTFTVSNKVDANVYTWNGTAVPGPGIAGVPDVNVYGWASTLVNASADGNAPATVKAMDSGVIHQATFASDVPSLATRTGTAQAGGASTLTLDSGANATDNYYKFQTVELTGGTGAGQTNVIASYVGSTKVATMDHAWATTPDNTSTFILLLSSALPSATALTGAQIATAIFTDTTAGDFTAANSVGKSIMNGVALGTGLTVNALTTNTDKTGYALTSAYDPAKTAAQAGDAMALTSGERNSTADALLDRTNAIETSITPRGALRLATAMAAGKTNGMDVAGTAHIRDVADGKNRVTATTDGAGNRTATSIDTT